MTDHDLSRDPELAARLPLDAHAGPAVRLSKERAAALIEHALEAGYGAAPVRKQRALVWQLAAAAVVMLALVGSAFAARQIWLAVGPSRRAAPAATKRADTAQRAPLAQPVVAAPQPEPLPTPVAGEPAPSTPVPHAAARVRTSNDADGDDLLQTANRLRAQGRFAEAADVYSVVATRHAGSISAYVAQVARGSIELEHLGDPARARVLFAKALRAQPGGALDLEARQGLALSLRDLGEVAAERAALEALIAAHPKSPAALRAKARLAELPRAGAVDSRGSKPPR